MISTENKERICKPVKEKNKITCKVNHIKKAADQISQQKYQKQEGHGGRYSKP
jgi:hypothetical protein